MAETCGRAGIRAGRAAGLGELEPAGKRGGVSRKHCQDVLALSPWICEPCSSHVLECAPRGRWGWQGAVPRAQLANPSPGTGMETPPALHVPPARNNAAFLGLPASANYSALIRAALCAAGEPGARHLLQRGRAMAGVLRGPGWRGRFCLLTISCNQPFPCGLSSVRSLLQKKKKRKHPYMKRVRFPQPLGGFSHCLC